MPYDKIRLGVRVGPRESEHSAPPVHYVYRWDRIIGALAVLLLAIGGVGYAGYLWLVPASEPLAAPTPAESSTSGYPGTQAGEPARVTALPAAPGGGEPQSTTGEPSTGWGYEGAPPAIRVARDVMAPLVSDGPEAVAAAADDPSHEATPQAGADSQAEPPATGKDYAAMVPTSGKTAIEHPFGAAASLIGAVSDAPALEPVAEVSTKGPAASRTTQAGQSSQSPPQSAVFRLEDVSVASPAVERFQLARSVINNEPRGTIESIVPKADGAAAVYCFSDVVGMKDKVLYYHWLRDGKRVAKVRVGAWGKRWRSHSSKILNPTMTGDWRVELRKGDNTLLASAEFVYR